MFIVIIVVVSKAGGVSIKSSTARCSYLHELKSPILIGQGAGNLVRVLSLQQVSTPSP